jgi:hypothetical protein
MKPANAPRPRRDKESSRRHDPVVALRALEWAPEWVQVGLDDEQWGVDGSGSPVEIPLTRRKLARALASKKIGDLDRDLHDHIWAALFPEHGDPAAREYHVEQLTQWLAWNLPLGPKGSRQRQGLKALNRDKWRAAIERAERRKIRLAQAVREEVALLGIHKALGEFDTQRPIKVKFGSGGQPQREAAPIDWACGPTMLVVDYWFLNHAGNYARKIMRAAAGDNDRWPKEWDSLDQRRGLGEELPTAYEKGAIADHIEGLSTPPCQVDHEFIKEIRLTVERYVSTVTERSSAQAEALSKWVDRLSGVGAPLSDNDRALAGKARARPDWPEFLDQLREIGRLRLRGNPRY